MKNLNKRETLILYVTLGLVILFVTNQWVIKPIREGSVDVNDSLRLEHNKLIKDHHMIDQGSLIEARYQNLVGLLGVADSDEAEIPAIVSKIESAARDNNIHIANIQPQKTVDQKEVRFLAVELEIDGQWLDIVNFLDALQQNPNFYFVDEMTLEKYSDTSSSLRGRIIISRMCLLNPQ